MNQENIIDNNKEEFPIVGIGASAGGLEAIEALFANMPSQTKDASKNNFPIFRLYLG